MFIRDMCQTLSLAYMYLILFCVYLTFIVSYINEGLKYDEQGNKQKALQFYHKGMKNHCKDLLVLRACFHFIE